VQLTYFREANFGDALNAWLMPKLFGDFFDDDAGALFIGIGSILEQDYPPAARKIVFGSGWGGFGPAPRLDATWRIHAVRGPLTAAAIGVEKGLGAGDGAILTARFLRRGEMRFPVSFIPHWRSLRWGQWPLIARELGLHLIDPRAPVESVLAEIAASGMVIAEAMHGAIIADALRVPWVALTPVHPAQRAKWYDWAAALDIRLQPVPLAPSCLMEAQAVGIGAPYLRWLRGGLRCMGVAALADMPMRAAAARSLAKAMRMAPSLSADHAFDRARDRLETAMAGLLREHS